MELWVIKMAPARDIPDTGIPDHAYVETLLPCTIRLSWASFSSYLSCFTPL
ncbi:hypothetical protein Ngar_c03040 [Candidatus Nitrososphaera gargensis Ga9.2]|uniref:Uncharacterized protein n=1 Tax=Nitrososphaera gargensis (strain Ga9.2) TaxID=1237085 RepID=K0IHH4_NITGG|nr:hypothetical protein Ngar_c03040 [Candidatus Nitrososphaera gargensis Ga9.2]